jgi:bifunctional DNA-binding transcriptional regulator/antitoxin component of YhaV-PrlF toxin-antitoxin module
VAAGMKDRIAKTYAELLAFASEARELGIDSSPLYQETMRWLQVKALADLLRRRLEKESRPVSDAEIEAYYREQLPHFEEVKLRRMVLPKSNFGTDDRQKFEHDVQRIAAQLRERAAHGEDLERLQKEGYEALGFSGLPPATDVGNRRRVNLPSEVREEVFSLRPGEVSKVEDETYSFVIYKVDAKWRLPKEQVREEITSELARQKLGRAFKSITGNVRTELNEKYFGTASAQ